MDNNMDTKQEILFKVIDDHEKGLAKLELPTGSGKTYAIVHTVADIISKPEGRKINFIFPAITRVARNELQSSLEDALGKDKNKLVVYQSHVDALKSYFKKNIANEQPTADQLVASILGRLEEDLAQKLKPAVKNLEWAYLMTSIDNNEQVQKNLSSAIYFLIKECQLAVCDKLLESDTPKDILPELGQKYVEEHARVFLEIWPELTSDDEHQIFLLTSNKLLRPRLKLFNKAGNYWKPNNGRRNVIILDEFEEHRNLWLDLMVENSINGQERYGIIQLVKAIASGLSEIDKLPSEFLNRKTKKLLKYYVDDMNGVLNSANLDLAYQFHLSDTLAQYKNPTFVFRQSEKKILSSKRVWANLDKKANVYLVNDDNKDIDLGWALFNLEQLIPKFVSLTEKIVRQCLKKRNQPNPDLELVIQKAEAFFLAILNNNQDQTQILLDRFKTYCNYTGVSLNKLREDIKDNNGKKDYSSKMSSEELKLRIKKDPYLYSTNYIKASRINESAGVNFYSYHMALKPESLLYYLALNSLVIGLSANCNNKSSITNFNPDFIKNMAKYGNLQLIELDSELMGKLKEEYIVDMQEQKESGTDWHTEFVSAPKASQRSEALAELLAQYNFTDRETISILLQEFSGYFGQSEDFNFNRELKTVKAILEIISNGNPHGKYLIFKNFNVKEGINWYQKIIEAVFPEAKVSLRKYYANEKLNTAELEQPNQLIIFTTYASLGRAVNLTVPLKKLTSDYVVTNATWCQAMQEEGKLRRDLDGFYCEMPTHTGSEYLVRDELNLEHALKLIYEQNGYIYSGVIPESQGKEIIRTYIEERKWTRYSKNSLPPVRVANAVKVEQAVGRKNRTPIKPIKMLNLFDADMLKQNQGLMFNYYQSKMTIPAIQALLAKWQESRRKTKLAVVNDPVTVVNDAISQMIKQYIPHGKFKGYRLIDPKGLGEMLRRKWEELRHFIAQHPYADKAIELGPWRRFYYDFGQPCLTWQYVEDSSTEKTEHFSRLMKIDREILDEPAATNPFLFYREIVHPIFSENPQLADKLDFIETDFSKPHRFWLAPAVIVNFYRAAVSELIIEEVLKEQGLATGKMPPEQYEMFDGLIYTKKGVVYWDAKDWQPYRHLETAQVEKEKQHVFDKLKRIGKLAIIINLQAEDKYEISEYSQDDVHVLTIPALFNMDGKLNIRAIERIMEAIND